MRDMRWTLMAGMGVGPGVICCGGGDRPLALDGAGGESGSVAAGGESGAANDAVANPESGSVEQGEPTSLSASAVGAWGTSGASCESDWGPYAFFLCPGGRIRGAGTMGPVTELLCGTYTVDLPSLSDCTDKWGCFSHVHATVKDTLVLQGEEDVDPDFSLAMALFPSDTGTRLVHQIGCDDGTTGFLYMERVAVDVTDDYCVSEACPASDTGGTESGECGTDCDCGHCWYCESGICRFGGEGSYGCYRGCSG
jgi:hypothetical protein